MIPQTELLFPYRSIAALRGLRGQLMNRFEAARARTLPYLEHGVTP
jgi:hypothetical protein